jgi:hypothetical protein
MRKPVKPMAHNKKSKPKPKPVSAKPKPKSKTTVAAKCKPCKPCKPCEKQYIYHHIHHHQRGENIGEFGFGDLVEGVKSGISSVKERFSGDSGQPVPTQRYYKRERNINTPLERTRGERAGPQTIPTPPPPPPSPPQQPQGPPLTTQLKKAVRFTGNAIAETAGDVQEKIQWARERRLESLEKQRAAERIRRQTEPPTVGDQWRDAINNAGQVVTAKTAQAVTPQGAYNIARSGARGAYRAGKFAVNESYKGMDWLEKKRQAQISEQNRIAEEKQEAWDLLPYEEKKDILQSRYMAAEMRHKLQRMRQQAEDYQLDKNDAYLSGRRFTPKVFKVNSENSWGDPTYMDEYGRELPGIPEEVTPKKARRPRSETEDINNIFGFSSGSSGPMRSPLDEPPRQRQIMGGDEGDYDMPRQRTRYRPEPSQQSSSRRINSLSPQKEAEDFRKLLM